VTASIHKLTAGDGYTYLTSQVARGDRTHGKSGGLDAYYTEQGETPGVWLGRGLEGLGAPAGTAALVAGSQVTEGQMLALFGEGRHPNADAIERAMVRAAAATPPATRGRNAGKRLTPEQVQRRALAVSALGRRYAVNDAPSEFRVECAKAFAAVNERDGLPRDWALPADQRARIRTEVATRMFVAEHSRTPGAGELDRWIIKASAAPTAVAGYDITFSPVKSVSALWAIAPRHIGVQIEAAHDDAVRDVLAWLEDQVAFTREGAQGVRQVNTTGLLAAAFTHRDSRAGDPDLHTHVAVSNKVATRDGRWLALDGRVVYRAMVAASERYNTRLEAGLVARLGVAFTETPQPDVRRRAVREVVGVPPELLTRWSSRRAAIESARADLAATFMATHGRTPTPVEAIKLAQQANLATRQRKHEPRSHAEQRQQWAAEAAEVLGAAGIGAAVQAALTPAVTVPTMVGGTFGVPFDELPEPTRRALLAGAGDLPDQAVEHLASVCVATVSQGRSRWQVWDIRAEAERRVRCLPVPAARVTALVDAVTSAAVSDRHSIRVGDPDPVPEPAALRRVDGSSVYEVAGSRMFTSPAILAAEGSLIAAAARLDGRAVTSADVEIALLESVANGLTLNPAQAHMVRDLACSGRRLQLAIAPAGSGKTTAMRVLAAAWTTTGGTVIGLAPTAVAAAGLRGEINTTSDTLAALTHGLATGTLPGWAATVDASTLVIVDEAGMAGTLDLAAGVAWLLERGASVRLVGDDQQLASISAGGVLRDLAATVGASTLSELVRFSDPAEAAATLALRAGDAMALGFYVDNDRVHVGDAGTTADGAYLAWQNDRQSGRDAVMLAPTRETVTALNTRAQADRITGTGIDPGTGVDLSDGTRGYAGDIVVTRLNDRRLTVTATDFVKNGDRWVIEAVNPDGSLTVRHLRHRRAVTLPAPYVHASTELGYASTVHGAQGITADACHVVVAGTESRQLLYVAMTRGRHDNHVYVSAAPSGDLHDLTRPSTLTPPTDLDMLTSILARDDAQQSASSAVRDLSAPAARLQRAAARYRDAIPALAHQLLEESGQTDATLTAYAESLRPGLTTSPAWATLRDRLAVAALDSGQTPAQVLHEAATAQLLVDDAEDLAAVLASRLPTPAGSPPLPWLPTIPAALLQRPEWAAYLHALAEHVTTMSDDVHTQVAAWTTDTTPTWARSLMDLPDQLRAAVAVWRAATDVPATDHRFLGETRRGPEGTYQRRLAGAITAALPGHSTHLQVWTTVAEQIAPALLDDSYWPVLVDQLDALSRAGLPARDLLEAAIAEKALPLEFPAASVWWRMRRHIGPAVLDAASSAIRPAWSRVLVDQLGPARAERVFTDPAWSSVVAAVHRATVAGWSPEQVLSLAVDATHPDLTPAEGGTATSDLARALAWRVSIAATTPTDPYADLPAPLEPDWVDEEYPPDLDHNPDWTPTPHPAPVDEIPDSVDEIPAPVEDTGPAALPTMADADAALNVAAVERALNDILYPPTPRPQAVIPVESPEQIRLAALNRAAADYYAGNLPGTWAADYLQQRLPGAPVAAGYAPAGWTHLVDHLRAHGASDTELVAAGLARTTSRGTLIDAFRDRLVLPINSPDGTIVGFVARRNPTAGDNTPAGPKYLNTTTTPLYDKGTTLYGIHHLKQHPHATPVLVEGPLDAEAVTAASHGRYIGVAPLGTALTDAHVTQLRTHITPDTPVLVATDPDNAGRKAAANAYWRLIEHHTPGYVSFPEDIDPADYYTNHGPDALTTHLATHTRPLANALIDRYATSDTAWAQVQLHAAHNAAQVVAALPPEQWPAAIDRIVATTHVLPEVATLEVADAATNHTYEQRHHRAQHASTAPAAEPPQEATIDAAMRAYRALQRRTTTPAAEPPQTSGPSLT